MREVVIEDVFAALVPEGLDYTTDEVKGRLTLFAETLVWDQWRDSDDMPAQVRFEPINWLVTNDPADVEKFQPAHDCESCREGNARAQDFLRENPHRWIVMGNMRYVEVWFE